MEQGAYRLLLDWQWQDTFLFPQLRSFWSSSRRAQLCFFLLYRRIFLNIFASLKYTYHLIAIEITTNGIASFFFFENFNSIVSERSLCKECVGSFTFLLPGNFEVFCLLAKRQWRKRGRSAAYFWAATKHNKQDGGRRREFSILMHWCLRLSSHSTQQIILVGENNEGILPDYNFRNVCLVPCSSSKSYV